MQTASVDVSDASTVDTSINDVSASPSAAAQDYANVLRQLENELGSLADTSEHKHDPSKHSHRIDIHPEARKPKTEERQGFTQKEIDERPREEASGWS